MKKIVLILACSMYANMSFAQTADPCDSVSFKTPADIKKSEACVLQASSYILSKPISGNPPLYDVYSAFILTWMDKSPDYTFALNENIMKVFGDKDPLFGVYLTCMAKAALDAKKVNNEGAIKLLVDYITNTDNKVKQTSKVKDLVEAQKAGKISKYIN